MFILFLSKTIGYNAKVAWSHWVFQVKIVWKIGFICPCMMICLKVMEPYKINHFLVSKFRMAAETPDGTSGIIVNIYLCTLDIFRSFEKD